MNKARKYMLAAALIAAAGLTCYQIQQAKSAGSVAKDLKEPATAVSSNNHSSPSSRDEEAELKQLEAENLALSDSLAQSEARNAQLNSSRLQAERLAQAYKEIADHAAATNPTNRFPTTRHVYAGLGSFMRRVAASSAAQADAANMTPEQIKAMQAEGISMLDDFSAMMKANQQLETQRTQSGSKDRADDSACLLFGALDLDEQQFTRAYGIIQQLETQAKAQNIWDAKPSPANQAAITAWNDLARKQIEALLNPDQTEVFRKLSTELLNGFRVEDNALTASFTKDQSN